MFISTENDRLYKQGIYLELVQWEYFIDAVSGTRLQDEYNNALRECDLVIYLFFTKAGKYTAEEFDTAYRLFKETGKPRIWTYFKDAPVNTGAINDDIKSLLAFKEKLLQLGHFYTAYANTDYLKLHFKSQLEKVLSETEGAQSQPISNEAGPNLESTSGYVFNEQLTRVLMEAIQEDSARAKKFLENAERIAKDWPTQSRFSDPAKEILAFSFVGILGIQLRKLMAIGKERSSASKSKRYLENCCLTAQRSLQLLCFSLLSKLWDYKPARQFQLNAVQEKACINFFEDEFEPGIDGLLQLLNTLLAIYTDNQLKYPVPELEVLKSQQLPDDIFAQHCMQLQAFQLRSGEAAFAASEDDCIKAENAVAGILSTLHFLAGYKMISIKSIGYHEMRRSKPHYLYRYTLLGVDNKANVNQEKSNYAASPANTDAIFLYKENYLEGLNLFPFLVDVNALTFEDGARICFYACRDSVDGGLQYRFQEDNSMIKIERNETNEEELTTSADTGNKTSRLNLVYSFFKAARLGITGTAMNENTF